MQVKLIKCKVSSSIFTSPTKIFTSNIVKKNSMLFLYYLHLKRQNWQQIHSTKTSWSLMMLDFSFLLHLSPSRHLEKCADVFEKLRVSISVGFILPTYKPTVAMFRRSSDLSCHVCVLQKVEDRVASDQELKLTELLRYYTRDIQAAKVKPSLCFCYISCVLYGLYNSTKYIRLYVL